MKETRKQLTFWQDDLIPLKSRTPFSSFAPAKPTVVFDTYWRFAVERQLIFFRRLNGKPQPWTDDEILMNFKFTNAYRASDRVSQYLIRNVIYKGSQETEEIFFRTILFKLFNKIETWELFSNELGEVSFRSYSYKKYDTILTEAMGRKQTIYSAAYIMPSGSKKFGTTKKHRSHLRLLETMMEDGVPKKISQSPSMKHAFSILLSYPMIGEFLAYQYVTDLNYSEICDFSEMEFVVPGPGALDGISKCFSSLGGLTESQLIRVVTERQSEEFERLGLEFPTLWGRPLQLIDCQNLFCEISKYSRMFHPDIPGISGRVRIKQKFQANHNPIDVWYPPKWNINHKIARDKSNTNQDFRNV